MKYLVFTLLFTLYLFAQSPWSKSNLYNEKAMSYFIPFELWLGLSWDGKRTKRFHTIDKMHPISQQLEGPFSWYHPYLKKELQVYKRTSRNNVELFTFYPAGIIKLYDKKHNAYLNNGIVFPLGYGWKSDKLYRFSQEVWIKDKHYRRELAIRIKTLEFKKNTLYSLSYDYFIDKKHIATYTYEVDKGLTQIELIKK